MRIKYDYPPNIKKIDAAFHVVGKAVLYAYGDIIYAPLGGDVPPWLVAHEAKHSDQQAEFGSVEGWWDRYIEDSDFRFQQELEAHAVEYLVRKSLAPNRQTRRGALKVIARKLSSTIYGNMVSRKAAAREIEALAAELERQMSEKDAQPSEE